MLVDGPKQAGLVDCSSIYRSKSLLKNIFFQIEYLRTYLHVLFFSSGDVFNLAIIMLLCLLPTYGHCLMSMAKLGLFLS